VPRRTDRMHSGSGRKPRTGVCIMRANRKRPQSYDESAYRIRVEWIRQEDAGGNPQ
jgi:hypothetical protein